MGGGDAGLKAIAKRQKQNGLGRLRLYCQMCEKQCRDENGFKCHAATPAHQRNLALFAAEPSLFVARFSKHFLAGFLGVLQQRYGSNPVAANTVYQDYIKDKEHVHMNSTQWSTLSEFVKDLGRRGVCRVEERDGALWVTFVDRQAMERKQRAAEMDRARLDEEERAEQSLARLMQAGSPDALDDAQAGGDDADAAVPVAHVSLRLPRAGGAAAGKGGGEAKRDAGGDAFKALKSSKVGASGASAEAGATRRRSRAGRLSVLDEIMAEERARGEARAGRSRSSRFDSKREGGRLEVTAGNGGGDGSTAEAARGEAEAVPQAVAEADEAWLRPGLTVKCVSKALKGGPYFKQKGIVDSLRDKYTAVVRLKESGAALELDQDDLETVLPKPGGVVVFVRGHLKGKRGTLESIEESSFSASIRVPGATPPSLSGVDYDAICKWAGS